MARGWGAALPTVCPRSRKVLRQSFGDTEPPPFVPVYLVDAKSYLDLPSDATAAAREATGVPWMRRKLCPGPPKRPPAARCSDVKGLRSVLTGATLPPRDDSAHATQLRQWTEHQCRQVEAKLSTVLSEHSQRHRHELPLLSVGADRQNLERWLLRTWEDDREEQKESLWDYEHLQQLSAQVCVASLLVASEGWPGRGAEG